MKSTLPILHSFEFFWSCLAINPFHIVSSFRFCLPTFLSFHVFPLPWHKSTENLRGLSSHDDRSIIHAPQAANVLGSWPKSFGLETKKTYLQGHPDIQDF